MFDAPVDAWYVWLGLTAASASVFGVAAALPAEPPPDAAGVATVVDGVATSPHDAAGEHPLPGVDRLRLTPSGVGLAGDGGRAHATFRYGAVTPVRDGRLSRLLDGASPGRVFDDPAALASAARAARNRDARWRRAPDRLRVRRLTWGEVDVTLVG